MKFPLIENVPVPATRGILLFKRKRISNEEYSVIPFSKIPS